MGHLIKSAVCTILIAVAMIYASNSVSNNLYTNVYVIVSKGSLSMVKVKPVNKTVVAKK